MSSNGAFIHVVRPGLFTTIQDLGRRGYQRFGVSVSGAMDPWALTVGNRLLGNHDHAAGLEITLQGPELLFEQRRSIAITGADLSPTIDGLAIPMWTVVAMPAGGRLQFGLRKQGTRAYVCIAGGIESPLVLGSRSTHVRSGLGGLEGRPLRKSDRLAAGPAPSATPSREGCMLAPASQPRYVASPTLRVMPGPQADHFVEEALQLLAASPYRVSSESDRMGYRLEGTELPHRGSADIISEAVTAGSIQVPSNRQPILLMADCQPTGGYAKLATMISADRRLAAQVGPGDRLSFVVITEQEASLLFRSSQTELDRLLPQQKC